MGDDERSQTHSLQLLVFVVGRLLLNRRGSDLSNKPEFLPLSEAREEIQAAMRRALLLFASQVLSFVTGVLFPIMFVRLYGHASYGDVALTVSYAGFFLTFIAGSMGQSILERGIRSVRFRQIVLSLTAASISIWLVSLFVGQSGWLGMSMAVVYILFGQSSLHLVYYYAIRQNKESIFTFLFGIETIPRILTILIVARHFQATLPVMLACYVASTGITVVCALLAMGPDEDHAVEEINAATSFRFLRWAISGVLISNFDRTFYASTLKPEPRSVFLFFNSLYTIAFSLIANSVSLEVLATRYRNAVASRSGFYALAGLGVAGAAITTVLIFRYGKLIGTLTDFDPGTAAIPILFTFAFRSLLFIQQLAYGYIERSGRTLHTSWLRGLASLLLLALSPIVALIGQEAVAIASLVIMAAVSFDAWFSVSRFYASERAPDHSSLGRL